MGRLDALWFSGGSESLPSSSVRVSKIPGKDVHVSYGDHQLNLFLDMGVGIGGDKWPAADMFCNIITQPRWNGFFTGLFTGKRVLELGSGNGVAGILIDKAYEPGEICISDLESHMKHICHNIKLNQCNSRTLGLAYDWVADLSCHDTRLVNGDKFDIILALECVYREDLYLPLINSIKRQSHEKTLCFLGCTRQFTKPTFFRLLLQNGLAYKKLPSDMLPVEMQDESIGLFIIHLI